MPYPGAMTTDDASFGGDLAVLAVVALLPRHRAVGAEAPGDDGDEGAVHRPAHDVAEVRTRAADERTGDDEQVVAEQEAGRGRRPPRVAVEHRDDDGHVAAADRGDEVPAETEGEQGDDAEDALAQRVLVVRHDDV